MNHLEHGALLASPGIQRRTYSVIGTFLRMSLLALFALGHHPPKQTPPSQTTGASIAAPQNIATDEPPFLGEEETEEGIPAEERPMLFELPDGPIEIGKKVCVVLTINGESKVYTLEFSREENSIFIDGVDYELLVPGIEFKIFIKSIEKRGDVITMEGKVGFLKGDSHWKRDDMQKLFAELFATGKTIFPVQGKLANEGMLRLRKEVAKN